MYGQKTGLRTVGDNTKIVPLRRLDLGGSEGMSVGMISLDLQYLRRLELGLPFFQTNATFRLHLQWTEYTWLQGALLQGGGEGRRVLGHEAGPVFLF